MQPSLSETRDISKREFLRRCLCGMGCISAGALPSGLADVTELFRRIGRLGGPSTWSKEALYYTRSGRTVRCWKCPNHCELAANEAGKCRNRVNYDGKLYSIAYGNPCAVHIDPIEKKPFFHFLPTTRAFSIAAAGCNLRCLNCQNWQISQFSPEETENYDLMPDRVVEACIKNGCESIAYTYSEPTTFLEYMLDTARLAKERNIKNLLKSNGYINEKPLRDLCKVLDAANIDLKTFDDEVYQNLSEARLAPVLRTLEVLMEEGVWLEITNLVVPNWTDNADTIKRMCEWLLEHGMKGVPLHFTRFSPLYRLAHLPPTPVTTLANFRDLALKVGLEYVYVGNVPAHPAENTYCHACGAVILERRGFALLRNLMREGHCGLCGALIPGIWH